MDELDRRLAHVDAQHWEQPWQDILNALPIPPRAQQRRCQVRVRARIVWADDGAQEVETVTDSWATHPRAVLVEVRDRRYWVGGVWLGPWDVIPHRGAATLWMTRWGQELDAPPWAG